MHLQKILAGTAMAAALSAPASAYTLYSTLGGAENGGDPLSAAGPVLADYIYSNSASVLTSVTLNLALAAPAADGFQIAIQAQGDPSLGVDPIGPTYTIATVSDSSLTGSYQTYAFSPASTFNLAANTFYAIGLVDYKGDSSAMLGNTVDPAVLSRPSVQAGGYYYNNGGVQANAGGPYELAVDVAAVPEPAAWAFMLVGFGGLGAAIRSGRRTTAAQA